MIKKLNSSVIKLLTCLIMLASMNAASHPGRVDKQGGHTNKQTGQYHCHKGACAGYEELEEARKAGRQFSTLYDRTEWRHWTDADRDCLDTRNELLLSTSKVPVTYKTDKQCYIKTGRWYDHYSNQYWTLSSDLDADHIVPLEFAHGHGGSKWNREQKKRFANDYENILLVEDSLNQSKGSRGPDEWLPPNLQYRCTYVKKFDYIMKKYRLTYAPSEYRIIKKMVERCVY